MAVTGCRFGCYEVHVGVTGSTSRSFTRKSSCVTLTGQIYVKV